jgi:hypothetical protein
VSKWQRERLMTACKKEKFQRGAFSLEVQTKRSQKIKSISFSSDLPMRKLCW